MQTVVGVITNPLKNIPGPWYSLWTDLVLKYHVIRGEKARYVHALHEKYGTYGCSASVGCWQV